MFFDQSYVTNITKTKKIISENFELFFPVINSDIIMGINQMLFNIILCELQMFEIIL